jgi:hypothetical protein
LFYSELLLDSEEPSDDNNLESDDDFLDENNPIIALYLTIININTNNPKNIKNIYPAFLSIGNPTVDEDGDEDEDEDASNPGANDIDGDKYSYILCIFAIILFLLFELYDSTLSEVLASVLFDGTKYTIYSKYFS